MIIRGGTSKGLYFLAEDLPKNEQERREVLLAAMGSPDPRQIDGLGGAHPLTSKVAIVSNSPEKDIDLDYLFLQVAVEEASVTSSQNCGNILAGVGPFAIEKGLVKAGQETTHVRIKMLNTGAIAIATVQTPDGHVDYEGSVTIDGVPGSAAPVSIAFEDIAGSSCGSILPTGNVVDSIDGVNVTCIDNGMPTVLINAKDLGLTGLEKPGDLEQNLELKKQIEHIRQVAGHLMRLGNVENKTVPKMSLVSPPRSDGIINTQTFIPHKIHEAIGVLGAVSVASACLIPGTVANQLASKDVTSEQVVDIEHPSGHFSVEIKLECFFSESGNIIPMIHRAALLRTSRLLMKGEVLIPKVD
jgi:4-oxalomesaconate tautomerase